MDGTIFNIQHFSTDDGPGIRTTVFFKGCPLRCRWCANPESQSANPEPGWKPGETLGYEINAEDVLREVEKDRIFYETSGGGMTLSGGEPLFQPDFSRELLELAGERGIHRAMETSGFASWRKVQPIFDNLDYLLYDVKTVNDTIHSEETGVSNRKILNNLIRIRNARPDLPIKVRTPVIPGVNDNEREIRNIAEFLRPLDVEYELLKYHRLGEPKYRALNRPYPMCDAVLADEKFRELQEVQHEILSGQRETYGDRVCLQHIRY